jgi:hypothetical protein
VVVASNTLWMWSDLMRRVIVASLSITLLTAASGARAQQSVENAIATPSETTVSPTSGSPVTPAAEPTPPMIAAETAASAARVMTADGKYADILLVMADDVGLLGSLSVSFNQHTINLPVATISTAAPKLLQTSLSSDEVERLPHWAEK